MKVEIVLIDIRKQAISEKAAIYSFCVEHDLCLSASGPAILMSDATGVQGAEPCGDGMVRW